MTLPISRQGGNKRLYYHSGRARTPTANGFSFYSQLPFLLARPNFEKKKFIATTTTLLSLLQHIEAHVII